MVACSCHSPPMECSHYWRMANSKNAPRLDLAPHFLASLQELHASEQAGALCVMS